MDRTVRVRLTTTPAQDAALADTTQQFTACVNAVAAYGWEHAEKNGVTLHHATYYPLKAQYPTLVSDLHIQARVKATETVKSALALKKQGRKAGRPQSATCPPRYNEHTFRVDWAASTVRLSTTKGRMTLPFHVPAYATKYIGGQVATADLICRDGAWWLHLVVGLDAPPVEPNATVVGVDLGLAQPAVTSTSRFLGQKRWRATEGRYFRLRRALQQKGTRSARRHLRHLRGKQRRFRRDCDHVLSKQVVQATPPGGTIVLECLTHIRTRTKARAGRQRRRLHGWSFAQLQSFITYKAEAHGCTVSAVDPRKTSQRCSVCGHTARTNRRSRAWFRCRACGYQTHSDRNAALNIAAVYRASRSMSAAGGQPVNLPTVSGAHASGPPRHKLSPRGDSR